jgi:hypothetical protein
MLEGKRPPAFTQLSTASDDHLDPPFALDKPAQNRAPNPLIFRFLRAALSTTSLDSYRYKTPGRSLLLHPQKRHFHTVLVHTYLPVLNRFCTRSPIVPWTSPGYTLTSIRRHALTGSERRTTQRFQMRLPLTVRWTTGAAVGETSTESRDVSSRGVYFFLSKDVREGSPVEILLTLPNEITLAGPVRVRCLGRVQRTEPRDEGAIGVVAAIERYEFLRGEDDSKQ